MAELRVRVELPDLGPDDGRGTVRMVLRDTSRADGLDPTIAETASAVPAGGDAVDLVLDVPAEAVDPRHATRCGRTSIVPATVHSRPAI